MGAGQPYPALNAGASARDQMWTGDGGRAQKLVINDPQKLNPTTSAQDLQSLPALDANISARLSSPADTITQPGWMRQHNASPPMQITA
ncbi:hypothetical protein JYU34_010098 [Plutella xylostella]|uniref:Uncharacterized protein n=1 Tax=Plutella xylostella TaxID=51655 RepID=A0ABQ7QI64_PLUXY|nr:hypothetical protein JYU34_010098 [Plutella xylostella]